MTLLSQVEESLKCMLFIKFQKKLASEIHHEIIFYLIGCSLTLLCWIHNVGTYSKASLLVLLQHRCQLRNLLPSNKLLKCVRLTGCRRVSSLVGFVRYVHSYTSYWVCTHIYREHGLVSPQRHGYDPTPFRVVFTG